MKELNKKALEKLVSDIEKGGDKSIGLYTYKDVKINVTRKKALSNNERSRKLYNKRRTDGLCIQCGKKVTKKNPATGKTFRYCDEHRERESDLRKEKRVTPKKTAGAKKTAVKKTAVKKPVAKKATAVKKQAVKGAKTVKKAVVKKPVKKATVKKTTVPKKKPVDKPVKKPIIPKPEEVKVEDTVIENRENIITPKIDEINISDINENNSII